MSDESSYIKEQYEKYLSDYDSSFEVNVTHDDGYRDYDVEIKYNWGDLNKTYGFQSHLRGRDVLICVYEDVYETLSTESLFIQMWFQEISGGQ